MARKIVLEERKDYTQADRDAMDDGDFGDPANQAFPIKSAQDVINAASRLHNAKGDQEAIKARIKRIAKRKGYPLPQTWQDDEGKDTRAMSGTPPTHDPFTGTHSHPHPANGAQGDDATHSHEHSHDGDADHGHSHADEAPPASTKKDDGDHEYRAAVAPIEVSNRPMMYAPFLRIDAEKREVIGQATAEVPDSYGTIFGYFPEAWERWRGNIREQHDSKKAVGRKVDFFPDDESRSVSLQSRVSRGAQDTWLKVEDNVLTGYSLSIIPDPEFGNDYKRWPRKEYQGKEYPYLPRYSIAEVSLVDNPACPGCDFQIVRADGVATDILDLTEEEVVAPPPKPEERVGARVGKNTKEAMHTSIAHTLHAAVSQMQNCGCPTCAGAEKAIDFDGDGDIDLGGYDDPDGDASGAPSRAIGLDPADIERTILGLIERALQPAYARLQGIAGTLSRNAILPSTIETVVTSSISRAVEALDAKLAALPNQASLDEVRSSLKEVKDQVVRIAEQPMPGGPILNANSVEKRLPTDPAPQSQQQQQPRQNYSSVYEAIRNLSQQGSLDTPDKQVDAVAAGLMAQRSRR